MNNVNEVDNNNVYLALEEKKSDEFILKQNKEALILSKNETIQRIARELVSIPAALVRLKWQNRREIYPLQVKEEIYGAVIDAIIAQKPELRDKIMGRLEANYQYILSRESATLRLSRKLSDGEFRTSNVTTVALEEEAAAKRSANTK
ncbi:cytoplasmic protein [Kosakonia sacchari]|uniref:cytoplasmic protein n=1 Tax=Kosakonia sacchari TaxID=1158459 RepID=UPI003F57F8FB